MSLKAMDMTEEGTMKLQIAAVALLTASALFLGYTIGTGGPMQKNQGREAFYQDGYSIGYELGALEVHEAWRESSVRSKVWKGKYINGVWCDHRDCSS